MSKYHGSVAYLRQVAEQDPRVWAEDALHAVDDLQQEVADLEADLARTPDFTAEEYNKLMEHLLSDMSRDGLILADMVRKKFGASARNRSANLAGKDEA